jgi:hypothetical protein
MKLEDQIRKLIAFKKPEPTALYEPTPMVDEPIVDSIKPKGGSGLRGAETCSYWDGGSWAWPMVANPMCKICDTNPQPFCDCLRAYNNPCYREYIPWRHHPDPQPPTLPPAFPNMPEGCPSIEQMDGPGYTEEEWVGNPETLSGERYIWNSWAWLTRTADGKLGEYDFHGLYNWPGDPETDGGSNPNFHPLDPDSLWGTIDGRRWYMRDIWAYWFGPNGGATFYPTLRERRMKEMGCFGIPLLRTNGACCAPAGEFGGFTCSSTTSNQCNGTFYPGRNCADIGGDNCGLAPNPLQQSDQTKKTKEAMDMVMSLLKRK